MNLAQLAAILTLGNTDTLAAEPSRRIIISVPDRKIILVQNGEIKRIYDVAVGKQSTPTPAGTYHIANRVEYPTWYGPSQVVPPGKANPLGTRWMGLGYRGYGIHGTNVPSSIGKAASHGCIRMRNQDVEELFQLVSIGDEIEIRENPPAEITAIAGGGN